MPHFFISDNLIALSSLLTSLNVCLTVKKILLCCCREWTLQNLVEICLCLVSLVLRKKGICASSLME